MSLIVDFDPIKLLNAIIPCLGKVLEVFYDDGWFVTLTFHEGGLRSPKISDVSDRENTKATLKYFLLIWGKPTYTGHIIFEIQNGEFTNTFKAFPGTAKCESKKKGFKYEVNNWWDYNDGKTKYEIFEQGSIQKGIDWTILLKPPYNR